MTKKPPPMEVSTEDTLRVGNLTPEIFDEDLNMAEFNQNHAIFLQNSSKFPAKPLQFPCKFSAISSQNQNPQSKIDFKQICREFAEKLQQICREIADTFQKKNQNLQQNCIKIARKFLIDFSSVKCTRD